MNNIKLDGIGVQILFPRKEFESSVREFKKHHSQEITFWEWFSLRYGITVCGVIRE